MASRFRLSSQKGSIVVEASLVVPIILLCVISIIYVAYILYQQACLQALADSAAGGGASICTNPSRDMMTGKVSADGLNDAGLYWRLFDTKKEFKEAKIIKFLEPYGPGESDKGSAKAGSTDVSENTDSRLDKGRVLKSTFSGERVESGIYDKVVYKKLAVNVKDTYDIPLGNILKIFALEKYHTVNVKSEAVIHEPSEFIRNTDFILATERELEKKYPKLRNYADKTRETISTISNNVNRFFNNE